MVTMISCLLMRKPITIYHEYPCRIEISHPRGRNCNHVQAHDGLFFSHFSKVFFVGTLDVQTT